MRTFFSIFILSMDLFRKIFIITVATCALTVWLYFKISNIGLQRSIANKMLRDEERLSHINTIGGAILLYKKERSLWPGDISNDFKFICKFGKKNDCAGLIDLSGLVDKYLVSIPNDPVSADINSTGYQVRVVAKDENKIEISAPFAEQDIILRRMNMNGIMSE